MDFYKRTAAVCKLVPPGRVATYGQIALLCEKPDNSRQVGYALNRKITEEVPAHRIINHQGLLSGAPAFEQPDLQKLLLADEGVEAVYLPARHKYKVNLKQYQWQPTLAEIQKIKDLFRTKGI